MLNHRIICVVAALLLSACQSTKVITDYDPSADFNRYQQYQWLTDTSGGDERLGPLMADRVKESLQRQLDAGLYRQAGEGKTPDFWLRYYITEVAHTSESHGRGSIGFGNISGNVGLGVSLGFPIGGTRVTKELQIIIDVLDGSSQRLAWRGVHSFAVHDATPDVLNAAIDKTVIEIWQQFPPR